ncbi:hypothetical protein EZV73_03575 [Acidaminobacter sp. JC074]|uniref:hypothetical protein n=1 Tax=Acidaminobacter sp. JC074 TaxID=2530199 RepID=UPI001F0F3135|nr:hypothetical protein [Acidaminobacter sp. JC074]MCH4886630.1 hypothetical protein [Acidaminobacter sp. JC074]
MKRFIYGTTLVIAIMLLLLFQFYRQYNKENVAFQFVSQSTEIALIRDGVSEIFIPNGVTLTATQPGVIPSGNEVTHERYVEWFGLMQEMGLNTVKVDALMPGKFYEAFLEYNQSVDQPLYLLQGVYFDEVALKDGYSPLDDKWEKAFKTDIEEAIDAVHGNANIFDSIYLFKKNPIDVSDYLLGYIIGVNWGADDITYSNLTFDQDPYIGDYFVSSVHASNFEIFLTRMLDHAATYEVSYYSQQSLYSIHSHGSRLARSLTEDVAEEAYDAIRLPSVIDAEHIIPGEHLKSGFFVNYDIEQVKFNVATENEQSELDKIVDYHSLPVIISAYGFPTGRFTAEYTLFDSEPYLDEVDQASKTANQYKSIKSSGVAGQFLRDWQDAWFKSSWYSYNLKVLDHSVLWRDLQTYAQSYGVIAFEPDGDHIHYEDGLIEEWYDIKKIRVSNLTSYSINHDASAFHILIECEDVISDNTSFYLGIDVTPNSGTTSIPELNLEFQQAVDFILLLEMSGNQEILVQDYYDVNAFRLEKDMLRRFPDLERPSPDSSVFNSIYQYSDDSALYFKFKPLDDNDIRITGKLIEGNNNPSSEDYQSTADWSKKDKIIEVRLPYGLLNFMSPASKMIIDDFNIDHTFRMKMIDGITLELVEVKRDRTDYAQPYYYTWDNWLKPTFSTRIKPMFYTLKEAMKD